MSRVIGINSFVSQLGQLNSEIAQITRGALGEAAGFVADEMKNALEAMPTHTEGYSYAAPDTKRTGATESEKQQIIDNFGISRFRESGDTTSTSIGFTGYVHTESKRFNDNVPTGFLMQAINYGSEFRNPTHTVDRAIRSAREAAQAKAQDYIDTKVNEIMN